jgi:branched-chain amino acid transport system permease protein
MTKKYRKQLPWIFTLVALLIIPLVFDPESSYVVYFLYMTFIYVALTQSWNLVAGYTGQVSLGHYAFFGLGAYVIAITWSRGLIGYLDPLGMFMAGCGSGILAILIGIPLLSKLRGDYFALGTLGLGEILRLATVKGGAFTGGPTGILLSCSSFTTITPHYFIGLFLALLAIGATWYISKSHIGLALVAVRDNEAVAAASGVNILKFKVFALAAGAFIAGLCGALHAYYIFQIDPQGFYNLNWTLYPVLMTVLGGPGTLFGPVMGAVFLSVGFELARYFLPEIHPIFSGLLMILAIMFLPNGLIGLKLRESGRAIVKKW